jgi:hypothetical protein
MTSSMLVRAFAREEASGSTPAERLDGQDSRLSGNVDTLLHRRGGARAAAVLRLVLTRKRDMAHLSVVRLRERGANRLATPVAGRERGVGWRLGAWAATGRRRGTAGD